MHTNLLRDYHIFPAGVIAVALFIVPPVTSYAQLDTIEGPATSSVAEVVKTTAPHPYKIEQLTGDRVFGDFVLGPGKVELSLQPGQSRTVNINVSNRTGAVKRFQFDVEDMTGSRDPDRTVVLLGEDIGPYTLKDLISIPALSFDLGHNERAIIPVTISIPPDAEPGGHYGSVLVKTVTDETDVEGNSPTEPVSAIISRIGTLFFVTVPGAVETAGALQSFTTKNAQTWFETGPVEFQILFENTGSIHLNPYGELQITNMFGEEVGYLELEPWFALPDSLRSREVAWNRDFLYGRYTATLKLNRGYDNVIDEATITFMVIPWKLVLGALVIVFTVLFLLRAFFRRFEFRARER